MAKSGLSLEVDCGELGGRVLTALRAERWRTAAEHALKHPSKTTGKLRRTAGFPEYEASRELTLPALL
jgi:hypothetical protein